MEQARGFLKKIIELIKKPEMRILPGQLAFFLVISIIPIIALIGTIATTLSVSADTITLTIGESVPKEIANMLNEFIKGQGINFNITIFFLSAFFLASNGTHSMIITSNEIYKIESRDVISRRIKAILMIVVLVSLFTFLLVVPVFSDKLFSLVGYFVKDQTSLEFFYQIFRILKYPLIMFILYFNIKLLYVMAPDERIPSSSTTKGALFTTICWIIATEIYAFYIDTFSKYSIFYGSISNLLILLLWIYILSYIFVLGMGINAGTYRKTTQKKNQKIA